MPPAARPPATEALGRKAAKPRPVVECTFSYIGPGPGLAIQGPALLILVGYAAALLAILTLPIRLLLRRKKRRGKAQLSRLVVVGLDGLEPTRTERLLEEGKLPHLASLAERGCYRRVATTCPPLSPVAWATFSTGVNPGKHGVFGFVQREADYSPSLAFSTVEQVPARWGPFPLPWKTARPRSLRKSKSFWTILGEHGVFSHVLRVPVTWPPEPFDGLLLSAMGAPDLLGTQGTYTLFGTDQNQDLIHGDYVRLISKDGRLAGNVLGPNQKEVELGYDGERVFVQGSSYLLKDGDYTTWVELDFGGVTGLVKFLKLDQTSFYMTAIQINPEKPATVLSSPKTFVVALSKILGRFATCGLAEDLGARDDRVLSLDSFLTQAYQIHEEREQQFFHSLQRTRSGLCAVVFDGTDRIQHMTTDEKQLDDLYLRMDDLVGRTLQELAPEDGLIVLSDHGFKPLNRLVDLNAWLKENDYLCLGPEGGIDWEKTRAYTLGLAGISLNLKGRERKGIVTAEQATGLLEELAAKLTGLPDGENTAILKVRTSQECYRGPYVEQAPDLIIGYNPGYGVNKEAARGKVGNHVIIDNPKPWVADHCFEPKEVPGVLFSSLPLKEKPTLRDLAPTILELFGVTPPKFQEGTSLLT